MRLIKIDGNGNEATYLDLGSDVEESKVSRDQVVGDASSHILFDMSVQFNLLLLCRESWLAGATYENVNLSGEDILGLLKVVLGGPGRSGLDLVESRGDVSRRPGLGSDCVEVGNGCVLALGEGDELLAGALDDGERY